MKEIHLGQGKVALVDDEDFDALSAVKWLTRRHRNTFYAHRNVRMPDGKWVTEFMHRVILTYKLGRDVAVGMHTDHVNGDGLDNRRENLREATGGQNQRNCRRRKANPSSQYLGVSRDTVNNKWQAHVMVDYKSIRLGRYVTELAAAQARETFIKAHPELNARSNFLREGEPG
jgi:hypothetical protein